MDDKKAKNIMLPTVELHKYRLPTVELHKYRPDRLYASPWGGGRHKKHGGQYA